MVLRFILKLGHARKLAEHGVAVQNPGQLRVGGNMPLYKKQALLGVDAAGNILGQHFQRLAAQRGRVLPHGDGVQVHHAEDAVVFLLHLHPVADGPQVVAQRQLARGLHAAEYDFFMGGCLLRRLYHIVLRHICTSSPIRSSGGRNRPIWRRPPRSVLCWGWNNSAARRWRAGSHPPKRRGRAPRPPCAGPPAPQTRRR